MQLASNRSLMPPEGDLPAGLCIGCAMLHHDYTEIIGPAAAEEYCCDKALPEAWIDGRRYRLNPDVAARTCVCRECNARALGVYIPV